MTKKAKIFTWTSVGIIASGGILSSIIMLVWKYRYTSIDLGKAQYLSRDNSTTKGLKFNFKWYADSTGNQFLTPGGYKDLDHYLSTHLYYGPESYSLKDIIFGNRNVIDNTASGVYYGQTRQIFINIEIYVGTKNLTEKMKIESVSEVIAHEYGHHFAHTYLKGYKSGKDIATKSTFSGNYETVWNSNYLTAWEKMNGYTNDTLAKHSYPTSVNGKKMSDIASIASLSDLYSMANKKNHPNPFPNSSNYYYWGNHNDMNPGNFLSPYFKSDSTSIKSLEYFYSADEQFTRITEMLMWPKKYLGKLGKWDKDSTYFVPQPNIGDATSLWSPQAYDLSHTKLLNSTTAEPNDIIYPNYPFDGTLRNRIKPIYIKSHSSEYYKYLLNTMYYGSQLSHIYTKNTAEIYRNHNGISIKNNNLNNNNEIKLSGYTKDPWKYIAIVNKHGHIIDSENLISNKYNNDRKSSVFHYFGRNSMNTTFDTNLKEGIYSSKGWLKPKEEKNGYIMQNFMKASELSGSNYSLYFTNIKAANISNITDKTKINTISNTGGSKYLTTYEEYKDPNSQYWKLNINNGIINFTKNY